MYIYSYVIPHDYGFAPNPYGGFLTLATCKPKIRKSAATGDFLVGTGSVSTVGNDRLVYAAEISDVVPLQDYGRLPKYGLKRPSEMEPHWRRHGDNIYFIKDGEWSQRRNNYHDIDRLEHDVAGINVLVCDRFWYFGESAIPIPDDHQCVVKKGPGHKKITDQSVVVPFIGWLASLPCGNHSQSHDTPEEQIKRRCTGEAANACS